MFTSSKNKESRTFAPPASVMTMLKAVRKNQEEMKLKAGECWSNADNLVFTNEIGERLSTRTVYRAFKKIVDGMGLHESDFMIYGTRIQSLPCRTAWTTKRFPIIWNIQQ